MLSYLIEDIYHDAPSNQIISSLFQILRIRILNGS